MNQSNGSLSDNQHPSEVWNFPNHIHDYLQLIFYPSRTQRKVCFIVLVLKTHIYPIDSGRIQNKGELIFFYRMYSLYCNWANSKLSETKVIHERAKVNQGEYIAFYNNNVVRSNEYAVLVNCPLFSDAIDIVDSDTAKDNDSETKDFNYYIYTLCECERVSLLT